MDRYTIGFLILVGWFVCFRMFPTKIEREETSISPVSVNPSQNRDLYEADASREKQLFDANCARCHNSHLDKKGTGPALMGVSSRIPGGDWIYRWVKNSAKMIEEGDPYAVKIWKENNKATMDPFPSLSEQQVDTIMDFIDSYVPLNQVNAMP